MRTQDIEYRADGARLVGQYVVDDTKPGRRAGVLVCHEGPGLTEHTKKIAARLAGLGYAAFAMDYHGDGKPLDDAEERMRRISSWIADATGIRARALAALDVLKAQKEVDPARLAAIGYCFGGTTALEIARSGADVKAVVGFHSGLATARPQDAKNIKGKVLVCIGAEDPIIPPEQRAAFENEMKAAGITLGTGSDNSLDPFYIFGDLDMLAVLTDAVRLGHLDHPTGDWVGLAGRGPAEAMGLSWLGLIAPGLAADLVLCRARNFPELFSRPQADRVVLRDGQRLDAIHPDYRELDPWFAAAEEPAR